MKTDVVTTKRRSITRCNAVNKNRLLTKYFEGFLMDAVTTTFRPPPPLTSPSNSSLFPHPIRQRKSMSGLPQPNHNHNENDNNLGYNESVIFDADKSYTYPPPRPYFVAQQYTTSFPSRQGSDINGPYSAIVNFPGNKSLTVKKRPTRLKSYQCRRDAVRKNNKAKKCLSPSSSMSSMPVRTTNFVQPTTNDPPPSIITYKNGITNDDDPTNDNDQHDETTHTNDHQNPINKPTIVSTNQSIITIVKKRTISTIQLTKKKKIIRLQYSTRSQSKRPTRSRSTQQQQQQRRQLTEDETQCLGDDLATMCRTKCKSCSLTFQHHRDWVHAKQSMIQGMGVFAKQTIPPNTFLVKYVGKDVPSVRARQRYVIQLRNKFVDAEGQRGIHKYVNHCCNGDKYQRSARLHLWSDKKGIEHISIVTNRQVDKGEELLVDYGNDYPIRNCQCPNCK